MAALPVAGITLSQAPPSFGGGHSSSWCRNLQLTAGTCRVWSLLSNASLWPGWEATVPRFGEDVVAQPAENSKIIRRQSRNRATDEICAKRLTPLLWVVMSALQRDRCSRFVLQPGETLQYLRSPELRTNTKEPFSPFTAESLILRQLSGISHARQDFGICLWPEAKGELRSGARRFSYRTSPWSAGCARPRPRAGLLFGAESGRGNKLYDEVGLRRASIVAARVAEGVAVYVLE